MASELMLETMGSLMYVFMMILYYAICFGSAVFQYICFWKIFVKAGQEGWKCLIPVYNLIVLFKFIGLSPFLLLIYLLPFLLILGGFIIGFLIAIGVEIAYIMFFFIIIYFIVLLGVYALNIVYMIYLGKAFNKSTAFIVGLVLVPVVFQAILAFDKTSVYGLKKEEKELTVENV
ncbi:MAG: hypothetical protein E7310_07405 [Clostridiales bacterium]|nr:hypothetical protein [Clostridiales bacterium]